MSTKTPSIGRRNRDRGFGMLLMHLDQAYKALYRHSNGPTGKAQSSAFTAAHKRWLKAQAAWTALNGGSERMPQAAFDRLVDKRHDVREVATERLAAIRSQDIRQLSCKAEALWDMLLCDFKDEAAAIRYGDFGAEAFGLFKSIRRDAARLAKGGA